MSSFFTFLKTRQFLIHTVIALVLIALIFWSLTSWLSSYTNHNHYVEVPDFSNQEVGSLDEFIKDKNVTYQIIDSLYSPKEKSGIVLRQDPEPKSKVKHNRIVYLYVTCLVAPQVEMPKLIDRSERQARFILETYGFKLGSVREAKADCNGCVIDQVIKGKSVEAGAKVKKGSVVSLIIGRKDGFIINQNDSSTSINNSEERPNFE
jgi:eukaryotic-like serine/threonine-protein kinase